MTRYLVTGATGFIGQYVTRALLASDAEVRVLVRCPERLPAELSARVEVHRGDVCDAGPAECAVRGVDVVLHLAACARAWSRDPSEFQSTNVDAVQFIVAAVQRYDVTRLVHVSTVLTLPQLTTSRCRTPYEESKRAGERVAETCERCVIVHPTRVYGAGPLNDANGVTRVIAAYLQGRFRARLRDGDVQANYVHVEDVACGILLAASHGVPGARYVLSGENCSLRDLLELVARLSGIRRRVISIPPRVALAAAAAAEAWGRLGGEVPITRAWVRVFLEDQRVSGPAPADYAPRSLEAGLIQTISWLRGTGRRST